MPHDRREFLRWAIGGAAACTLRVSQLRGDNESPVPLKRAVGITTSSLSGHLMAQPAAGKFTLLQLPRILRDELDMRVIDLNTSALASYQPEYLDRVRRSVEDAGCVITNLKLNQPGLDMNSPEEP